MINSLFDLPLLSEADLVLLLMSKFDQLELGDRICNKSIARHVLQI